MPLGRRSDGPIRRGRADPSKRRARDRVLQLGHEAVENLVELLSGNRGQDHQRYVGYGIGYAEGRLRAPSGLQRKTWSHQAAWTLAWSVSKRWPIWTVPGEFSLFTSRICRMG